MAQDQQVKPIKATKQEGNTQRQEVKWAETDEGDQNSKIKQETQTETQNENKSENKETQVKVK